MLIPLSVSCTLFNRFPPVWIFSVPLDHLRKSLLKRDTRAPAKFVFNFRVIKCVSTILARTIVQKGKHIFLEPHELQNEPGRFLNRNICPSAHEIRLTNASPLQHSQNSPPVVLYLNPVALL